MYDLGSRIKSIRQKRGITQKELALRINKSTSAVSSYECNAQLPPLDVIEDIAGTLNVSIDYLVGTDKFNTISIRSLSETQSKLLDLLLLEFETNSIYSGELTQTQITLLQKLIIYFVSNELIIHTISL